MLFCGINISKIFISRMVATLGRICTKKKKKKKMESKKKKKKEGIVFKKKNYVSFVEKNFSIRRALARNIWNKNSAAKKTL